MASNASCADCVLSVTIFRPAAALAITLNPLLPLWHQHRAKPRPRCEINSSADSKTPDGSSKIGSRRISGRRLRPFKLNTRSEKGMPQVHFHALRHPHQHVDLGRIDIVQISKRLGHASPTITPNTYSHLFKKDDDDIVSALAKALGGKI